MQVFLQILTLLGSVALFLFGLSLLSGGLQKVSGDGLRSFLASMTSKLSKMVDLLDEAFKAMMDNLKHPQPFIKEISNSELAEDNINDYRNALREEHIDNCENPDYNYQTGVFYIDIVQELEKMGDFIINISQSQLEKAAV